MFGDTVQAVVYEQEKMDMVFYPTKAGIKSEVVLKEKPEQNHLNFKLTTTATGFYNEESSPILFKQNGLEHFVLFQPLVKYKKNENVYIDFLAQNDIKNQGESEFDLSIIIDEKTINDPETQYPIKLNPSFEMNISNIPHAGVHSNVDKGLHIQNYAIIGYHPIWGEGWEYSRFRFCWFMSLDPSKIISANYYVKGFLSHPSLQRTGLYKVSEEWSDNLSWAMRVNSDWQYSSAENSEDNGWIQFDISEFVLEAFADPEWMTESNGLLMKQPEGEGYQILATSNNYEYTPYVRIDLTELPISFHSQGVINPS